MKPNLHVMLPILVLTLSSAASAATVPAAAADELRAASRQLDEAALLRNVASDRTETQHLLAALDLLREAEPSLDPSLRGRARALECEIGHETGAVADLPRQPPLLALAPFASAPPVLDRDGLGELAQLGQALARRLDAAES